MRTLLVVIVLGLVAGCSGDKAVQMPPQVAAFCAHPYSGQSGTHVGIHLTVSDNNRKVTVHLCDWINVRLVGPLSTVRSSDDAILKIVPLPLPAPPPGGTNLVYEAERTGSTVLSSSGASIACPPTLATPGQTVCQAIRWSVTVSVVT